MNSILERQPAAARRRRRQIVRVRRAIVALAFLSPALLILGVFRVFPMTEVFRLSFTRWNGYSPPEYIGLANFRAMLDDPTFVTALKNNAILMLALPVWVLVPLTIAMLLHSRIPGWRLFRLAFFLPAVLSPVIIGAYYEIALRYDGPVNTILRGIGADGLSREWLANTSTALPTLMAIVVWASFGIGVLVFLAALSTVDQDLLDAGRLDGATWLQLQRDVTFWQILPTVEFWSVIVLISSFTHLFPFIATLTGGGPGFATYVLEYYVYQSAFGTGQYGYASAVGLVLFGIVLIFVAIQLRLFRNRDV